MIILLIRLFFKSLIISLKKKNYMYQSKIQQIVSDLVKRYFMAISERRILQNNSRMYNV